MLFLSAKDVRNIEERFIELLEDIPADKSTKQEFFENKHIPVPKTNYILMWETLVERIGRPAAGEAVFECLLFFADDRLKKIIYSATEGIPLNIRNSEARVIMDIFNSSGQLRRIGELLIGYILANRLAGGDKPLESIPIQYPIENVTSYPYDVALSFAGEDRWYVEQVANLLREEGIKVFYDKYEQVDLWGKDLYVHLDEVYQKHAKYCVMFISQNYAKKLWTNHERQSAQARAFQERREYILPVRLDDTEIPGIRPTVGYVDGRKNRPEEIAQMILIKCTKD